MKKKKTLAILRPGKYLMLNHNRYYRLDKSTSVLLVDDIENYNGLVQSGSRVALHGSNLLIVRKDEVQIQ